MKADNAQQNFLSAFIRVHLRFHRISRPYAPASNRRYRASAVIGKYSRYR
jgi:hypothetical protein